MRLKATKIIELVSLFSNKNLIIISINRLLHNDQLMTKARSNIIIVTILGIVRVFTTWSTKEKCHISVTSFSA